MGLGKIVKVLKVSVQQGPMTGVKVGFLDLGRWIAPLSLLCTGGNVAGYG